MAVNSTFWNSPVHGECSNFSEPGTSTPLVHTILLAAILTLGHFCTANNTVLNHMAAICTVQLNWRRPSSLVKFLSRGLELAIRNKPLWTKNIPRSVCKFWPDRCCFTGRKTGLQKSRAMYWTSHPQQPKIPIYGAIGKLFFLKFLATSLFIHKLNLKPMVDNMWVRCRFWTCGAHLIPSNCLLWLTAALQSLWRRNDPFYHWLHEIL